LSVEIRAIRRIGLRQLFGSSLGTEKWQEILPVQAPRRWVFPRTQVGSLDELFEQLELAGVSYAEGAHAIYLSPESLRQSPFSELAEKYPSNAGLKIIKKKGGVADSSYALGSTAGDSRLHVKLIHHPRHLSLVACLFFTEGVGPRLYDFTELQCGDQLWTAYVIEDVDGRKPTLEECRAGICKLRDLEERGLIRVLLPEGFDDPEFDCPDCSNNARMSAGGSFYYVDFQNFLLTDYKGYLTNVANDAVAASHFGERSVLRGGRYLYQSIPCVDLPGKRSIKDRSAVLEMLMKEADVSVSDRLVLDIGCNIGMMMAQYLKLGAAWCHGWDREHITPHAERILFALGCTRFSTTGGNISYYRRLENDLPEFLKPALEGCVISYLAVHGHVGWLKALSYIHWSFIIYEGHEGETRSDFDLHIRELKEMVDCTVVGFSYYVDGDSDRRPVAILRRAGASSNAEK
jgi:hypothetical protein